MLLSAYLNPDFCVIIRVTMASNPENILKKARSADQNALAKIYDLYSSELFVYAYKHLGNSQAAEDIIAETFKSNFSEDVLVLGIIFLFTSIAVLVAYFVDRQKTK